jgi:putative acetyltransferase
VQLDLIYQEPGLLLLAQADDGTRLGCVGLRVLPTHAAAPVTGEIRRLFVRDQARGTGLGRRLAEQLVVHAQEAEMSRLVLNTLPAMTEAQALYSSMGFESCSPYVDEPLDGVLYYSRSV